MVRRITSYNVCYTKLLRSTIGAGEAGTVRDGMVYVKLSEKRERNRSQDEITRELRERLARIPGIVPSFEEVGRVTGQKPLMINIRGPEIGRLKEYAGRMKRELAKIRNNFV